MKQLVTTIVKMHPSSFKVVLLSLVFAASLLLQSCECKTQDQVVCIELAEASLVKITDMSPVGPAGTIVVIDSLTPTFSWNSTGPCLPLGWYTEIAPLYGSGQPILGKVDALYNFDVTATRKWTYSVESTLKPKTFYILRVKPLWSEMIELAELYEESYIFQTGPVCTIAEGEVIPAPELVQPGEGELVDIGDGFFQLSWETGSSCVWPYEYQVSNTSNFNELIRFGNSDVETVMLKALQDFDPEGPEGVIEECNSYYWRVRVKTAQEEGPWSSSRSFQVSHYNGEACEQPKVEEKTELIVSIPSNTNCRSGPATAYPVVVVLSAGSQARVDGRNDDGSWWWLYLAKEDIHCWVGSRLVSQTPNPEMVPFQFSPPLPTATFTPVPTLVRLSCSQITNIAECRNRSDCEWYLPATGGPAFCRDK